MWFHLSYISRLNIKGLFLLIYKNGCDVNIFHRQFTLIIFIDYDSFHGCDKLENTGDVSVDFTVTIDLEVFGEKTGLLSLVIVESMGVFGPSGDLEIDTE